MAWLLDVGFWLLGLGMTFIFGLWLVWFGLFGSRSKGRPRCPKCWYDMQGASAAGTRGIAIDYSRIGGGGHL